MKKKTFRQLHEELKEKDRKEGKPDLSSFYDSHQLDCLLHPEINPIKWERADCGCEDDDHLCIANCLFNAIHKDEPFQLPKDKSNCEKCNRCINQENAKKLASGKDIIPVLKSIYNKKGLIYALVAPAFLGQFGPDVTPAKLRTALKKVGFDGMVEVALFADILTLKEALEFDANIVHDTDYQLTSCCCPLWIAMIRKKYNDLLPHVPPSVSPMIASGRTVKLLHPDAVTVFIGPCIAKKAEAREPDIAGAIDHVLTFQEINDIFAIMEVDPHKMEESFKDHSSRSGRIYAHAGGVSEAVQATLQRISPNRKITLRAQKADGVKACKEMMQDLVSGKAEGNFFEGMGCVGGCVGGPKAIIPTEQGRENVKHYGSSAVYPTPIDNPYVIELLERLGFETTESLMEDSEIFTRKFE